MNFFWLLFVCCCAQAAAQTPVILISIDTLRADHVGIYGYKTVATPNLDAFARGGTVFESIDCQTPLTLPSHTSLLTSTYPFQTGVQENAEKVPPGITTLATVLKSHGYATAAFVSSVFLESEMGFDQGFDVYDSPFHFAAFSPVSGEMFFGGTSSNASYTTHDRRDGSLTLRAALRWLAQRQANQPFFLFLHFFDLHTPYTLPERPGISRYDAQLELEDEIVGRLKNSLVRLGLWDKALTILFSDHGEGLGDHGEQSHGYFIYESTLHVPLIFHWPAGTQNPSRRAQPGGLIDVAPTLLDFLHFTPPPTFAGASLFGPPHLVYSETMHTHDSFGWAALRSVRDGNDKYIEAPKPELYDLAIDSGEQKNLVAKNTERTRALRSQLGLLLAKETKLTSAQPRSSTSPETEKLLASLGYVGRGPQTQRHSKAEADPKDKLAEFRLYEHATEKLADRQLPAAMTILKQVLAQDPANILARRDLASCYLDLRDYSSARVNFKQVVAVAPDDYPSQYGLGLAAKHLGRKQEAREHLEAACRLAPAAAQCKVQLEETER